MAIKRISIDAVRLGMYIIGVDRSWLETPFLKHWFVLTTPAQIAKLQQAGIQYVDIDTERGLDALPPPVEADKPQAVAPPTVPDAQEVEARLAGLPETLRGHALSDELHEVRETHQHMLDDVKQVLDAIRTSGRIRASQVQEFAQEMIAQTVGKEEIFGALVRTREFSPDLYHHALSVSTLGVLVGRLMGLASAALQQVTIAGLLHDVGLLRLPPNLLRPLRTLSETERELYATHPQESLAVLRECPDIPDDVLHIIAHHHLSVQHLVALEGKSHEPWAVQARLIRVVDEYDELLTGQGVRPPLSVNDALGVLYQMGKSQELDSDIVTQLITQIGIYPLYSLVELNSGERGIVTGVVPEQLLYPTVLLITHADGHPYEEPIPVNFSAPSSRDEQLEIVRVLDAEQEGIQIEEALANWVTL